MAESMTKDNGASGAKPVQSAASASELLRGAPKEAVPDKEAARQRRNDVLGRLPPGTADAGGVKPEHRVHGPGWLGFSPPGGDVTKIRNFVKVFGDAEPYHLTPELSLPELRAFVRGLGVELLDVDSTFSTVEALIDAFNNVDWSGSGSDERELSALASRKVDSAKALLERIGTALRTYAE